MAHFQELSRIDTGWEMIFADIERLSAFEVGAFGHVRARRIGLRVATKCWALVSSELTSAYALAVELSPTGAVLRFVGQSIRPHFRANQRLDLTLFFPEPATPVRFVARPVRRFGEFDAFEFIESSPVDRLTLAEFLDHLMANPALRTKLDLFGPLGVSALNESRSPSATR